MDNLKTLVDSTANFNDSDFANWLMDLTPSELAKVELYLYRNGHTGRAKMVEEAGIANCGNDYYNY